MSKIKFYPFYTPSESKFRLWGVGVKNEEEETFEVVRAKWPSMVSALRDGAKRLRAWADRLDAQAEKSKKRGKK